MEEAIKSTLEDARKIEQQISAVLLALQNEDLIKEANLLPLPTSRKIQENLQKPSKGGFGKGKVMGSQMNKKALAMDSVQIPMGTREEMPLIKRSGGVPIYTLIEDSLFLLPIKNEWVFGMNLVNSSGVAQNCPELLLNLLLQTRDRVDKRCQVFHYRVQVHPLDVKISEGKVEGRKVGDGIPFHDTFRPIVSNSCGVQIQAGCQVLATATFQHPLNFIANNKLDLIVSLICNERQIWSRVVHFPADSLETLKQIESNFLLHQTSILMALGKHMECFKMNRLLLQGDKSPPKAVEKWLVPLGFERISSESLGIDAVADVFASVKNHLSPLWGTTFKFEKCARNANTIKCIFTARSTQQAQIFRSLFQDWLKKEGRQERSRGLAGLSVLPISLQTDDKNVINTIQDEINVINDLVDLKHKIPNQGGHSGRDSAWINKFVPVLSSTDDTFMNHLCLS